MVFLNPGIVNQQCRDSFFLKNIGHANLKKSACPSQDTAFKIRVFVYKNSAKVIQKRIQTIFFEAVSEIFDPDQDF